MKYNLLMIFLICAGTAFSQQSDTMLNPLRSTRIHKGSRIALQANINTLKDISFQTSAGHYNLKKGTFGGADSVDIEVSKNNLICAVSFLYDTAYEYEKGHYVDWLKTPGKEYSYNSDKMKVKATKWEDKRTIYELVEVTQGTRITVYSTIFDKELYFAKKPGINLRTQGSLEVLKWMGII